MSVALTKGVDDLQTLLNHDAKPYITTRLKTLFDQQPHMYYADPPPLELYFKPRQASTFSLLPARSQSKIPVIAIHSI